MKKLYFSLIIALSTSLTFSQNTFNNGGGNLLWSNSANWTLNRVPNSTDVTRVETVSGSIVDANFTIFRMQNTFAASINTSIGGGGTGTITIDPGAGGAAISNVSNNNVELSFTGKVEINNPPADNSLMNMANGAGNSIVFEDGSTLTLTTNLQVNSGSNSTFNFNGSLAGSGALRLSGSTTSIFGSTSNNSGFAGDFVYIGSAAVIVNSADNNVFLPSGRKLQINANNGSVQINGTNVFDGNITVGGSNTFTVDMNKNQDNVGTIVFSASGTLNLDVDAGVTALAFADNSASTWNSGTLNITGFKPKTIRFGTDANGLTAQQLSQITANGNSGLTLDAFGYLTDPSLSSNKFESFKFKVYPNPVSDVVKIDTVEPLASIEIMDVLGKTVEVFQKNLKSIDISRLPRGMYLLRLETQDDKTALKKIIKR